ncbi:MAG: biosynthetic-type acetolactate synthase large subunit [Candidatus Peribacteraceae bacterium]|nr:biosynthetic-type acetolactate synthase large subunit [Candidatus Peribacteraceae bacterium]
MNPVANQRPYTVSDAILDVLKAHGVTHLFGYPGGAILPFYDALPFHPEIRHVLTRNEQGAAFMAGGFARSTKKLGVCCATSGPGATNLVTGIFDAMMDSIPVLAITGQVPLAMIGKDMFQEVDITGVTMPITKHNYLLDDPKNTVSVLTEAIKVALSGRPGPVLVDVPKDILASPHLKEFTIPEITLPADPMDDGYKSPNGETMEAIITALSNAERPVMLLGHGVVLSHAETEAQALIEKLGIPVVTTILGKGILPHDHPLRLGYLGMHGHYHCNMAAHNADVILNVGSRFDDRIVGRYDVFGHKSTVIHVDIDRSELCKVVKTGIPVQSDAKMFLTTLLKHRDLRPLKIQAWLGTIKTWETEQPYEKTTPHFSIRNCLKAIDDLIKADPERYIVVVDVGQHQMWAMLSCSVNDPTKWLASGGAGSMGFGLPSAIGAAFAHPEKTVLCITGDGGIQMNIQELGVLQDYPLNLKILVMNNGFLGMVRQWQELFYANNYSAVAIKSPDFIKIADAYGIHGSRITDEAGLRSTLETMLKTTTPALVDCIVEPEENVFPMVPGGKHLGETITSSPQDNG